MSTERDIQILEHNISKLETQIGVFQGQNISDKKIERLEAKKTKYETQLAAIQ